MTYKSKKDMILFSNKEYPMDTHVTNFPISVRAKNTLKNMGIHTLYQLMCSDTSKHFDQHWIPNCGSQTREEIKAFGKMITDAKD